MKTPSFTFIISLALLFNARCSYGAVIFDSLSNIAGISGVSTVSAPITGQGNRYTGVPLNLANFTSGDQVTEIQVPLVNTSGATITTRPVRVRIWMWNTVDFTAASAFADQVGGAGGPNIVADLGDVSLANNSFLTATIAVAGIPYTPTSGTRVGITFNYQIDNGLGFVDLTGLNTGVIGGAAQTAGPVVGTNALSGPNFGYFRSVNTGSDVGGNFLNTSSRNIGINSGIALLITTIPEAGSTMALSGVAGLVLLRRRRSPADGV